MAEVIEEADQVIEDATEIRNDAQEKIEELTGVDIGDKIYLIEPDAPDNAPRRRKPPSKAAAKKKPSK